MVDQRLTFQEIMAVESVGEDRYMSLCPAWAPNGRAAYGGIVYAQATWAAAQTVEEGLVVHSVNGHFTLPGLVDRPYIFFIEQTSEGRSYCTRTVTVRQPISPSSSSSPLPTRAANVQEFHSSDATEDLGRICFKAICSFKKDEQNDIGHQEVKDLSTQYSSVLSGKKPKDHAHAPSVDAQWYYEFAKDYPQPLDFPGLDMRKVDMENFNIGKSTIDYRQLLFYRLLRSIPKSLPNLHACAHLYASDRNSLFLISNAMGFSDNVEKMASLSHSVVFHVDSNRLLLPETDGEDEVGWFCQEAWTPRSESGRGQHESKIWTTSGLHIASSWQDGLVRRAVSGDPKQKAGYLSMGKSKI